MRFLGVAAIVAAAILWGTTGTVQALLPETRDPLAVGALRLVIGAAALAALALVQRTGLPRGLPLPGLLLAAGAIAGYNLLFFHAVTLAGVGIGTAVTIGSAPIWTSLYEFMVERRAPGRLRGAGQVLSIAGVALLGIAGGGVGSAPGIALALAAGACYASYSLATSRLSGQAPSTLVAATTFGLAAILAAPVLLIFPPVWLDTAVSWGAIAFLGIGATGLSYAFYTWGLGHVAASTAVTLALAEPVTAWLFATWIVGEPVTSRSLAGVGLILAGLALVAIVPRDQRQ
ncbi:DMT family transporter [Palleronia sp. LCG004]|uniref:DMT family transporter n=1 Tax=Palleronia sp. LCG004 TaxID=3079304 RepID=UPI002943D650|nr:EamA family transporter [Palleronia sp. LCG004]WOI56472.1 EamA family transporter [Palleronia sp. LCG004]